MQGHMAVELSNGGGAQLAWRTRRHFVEHVACSGVAGVGCVLGHSRAELDLGPNMKFAYLAVLYNFH